MGIKLTQHVDLPPVYICPTCLKPTPFQIGEHWQVCEEQHFAEVRAVTFANGEYIFANQEFNTFEEACAEMDVYLNTPTFPLSVPSTNDDYQPGAPSCNNIQGSEIDAFIPHQANKRIITATADRLSMRPEAVIVNIEEFGNTTAGTIPLAMETARQQGKLKKGSLVLLASVGAGFTSGATLLRWAY